MNPLGVWQGWDREVSRLLPEMGVWQQPALALFSLGVASAKHCGTARVAAVAPGATSSGVGPMASGVWETGVSEAQVESIERRLRRSLNDRRLTAATCYEPAVRTLVDWGGYGVGGSRPSWRSTRAARTSGSICCG